MENCSTKLYMSPRKATPIAKMHPLRVVPARKSCPNPLAQAPAAATLRNAATLGFLPVRPMPPLSRGIKEQLQADRQHVRQSLWAPIPHMDMGKGWGRSQARASELQWHSMDLSTPTRASSVWSMPFTSFVRLFISVVCLLSPAWSPVCLRAFTIDAQSRVQVEEPHNFSFNVGRTTLAHFCR